MKMSKKMYEISEKMDGIYKEAEKLHNSGEVEKASELLDEFDRLKAAYDAEKRLYKSYQSIDFSGKQDSMIPGTSVKSSESDVFYSALRKRFKDEVSNKGLMSEGNASSAGYTVPKDDQTKINEFKSDRFCFEQYIGVENVTTKEGSRVFRAKGTSSPLVPVLEGGRIPIIGAPQYQVVAYSVKDFGGIIPVTNDLLDDTTADLRGEIIKHLAMCREDTINAQVLSQISAQSATGITGIDGIRSMLLTGLGGAYTATSKIYTNDDGYAYLTNLKDKNDRDYFFYNPADPGQIALNIGGIVVPFVHVPNEVMASTAGASSTTNVPFVLGDLQSAFKMFDRRQMAIKSTDQGIVEYQVEENGETVTKFYNAFQDNLTLFKAFMRADFKTVDSAAFKNCYITV